MTIADILAESKTFSLDLFPPGTVANVEKRFEAVNEKTGKPAGQLVESRERNGFSLQRGGQPAADVVQDEKREDFGGILRERVELAAEGVELGLAEIAGEEIKQPPNAVVSGHRRRVRPDG